MSQYIMRAVDSITSEVHLWVEPETPDFDGDNYPGPNDPLWITALATRDSGEGPTGPQGPQGDPGPTGAAGSNGTNGTNGKSVLSGSAVPGVLTGTDGDFYIRTTTWEIYGPKAAGAWGSPTSLIGPEGPAFSLDTYLNSNPLKFSTGAPSAANASNEMGAASNWRFWGREISGGTGDPLYLWAGSNGHATVPNGNRLYAGGEALVLRNEAADDSGVGSPSSLLSINATDNGFIGLIRYDSSSGDVEIGDAGVHARIAGTTVRFQSHILNLWNATEDGWISIVDNASGVLRFDFDELGSRFMGPVGVNGASPPAQPTITGSRSGATAAVLAQVLQALEDAGWIVDSTTA